MIQRIQSLWLLLAAISIALLFKFPYYSAFIGTSTAPEELTAGKSLQLFILAVVLGVLSLVVIFLYKHRTNQKRLIWLGILAAVLFIALMYFKTEDLIGANPNAISHETYKLGAIFPVLYIIFMIMAFTAIRKDEKLIKSVDRLRN